MCGSFFLAGCCGATAEVIAAPAALPEPHPPFFLLAGWLAAGWLLWYYHCDIGEVMLWYCNCDIGEVIKTPTLLFTVG